VKHRSASMGLHGALFQKAKSSEPIWCGLREWTFWDAEQLLIF
jgi:hypothetical protein